MCGGFYYGLLLFIMILCLIGGIPIYRIEKLRYHNIYDECWDQYYKDKELSDLDICKNPILREKYKERVNCEASTQFILIHPADCAVKKWWFTFWPVKTFQSLEGSYYMYFIVTLVIVVIIWGIIGSCSNYRIERMRIREQGKIMSDLMANYNNNGMNSYPNLRYRSNNNSNCTPKIEFVDDTNVKYYYNNNDNRIRQDSDLLYIHH